VDLPVKGQDIIAGIKRDLVGGDRGEEARIAGPVTAAKGNIINRNRDSLSQEPEVPPGIFACVFQRIGRVVGRGIFRDPVLCLYRPRRDGEDYKPKAESKEGRSASISRGGLHCRTTVSGSFRR
jgi:hypothetical protein